MTVRKINGFRAPYRSLTFREESHFLVQRNGVMYIQGAVTQAGLDITVPPFAFIQQGLMTEVDTATVVTAPSMEAPYYLTVSALSVANVDDLRWQFAKSPLDLTESEVIVASYDGIEWRAPQILSLDGVYTDIDDSNVDFDQIGPFSGLLTTLDGGDYRNAAGKLVDQQGLRTRLGSSALFTQIAADPDYSRVDKILYRRPDDARNRIGVRKLLVGGSFALTPSALYNTQYLDASEVRQSVKVLVASDNTAHIFTVSGYGTSFQLLYTKVASDRQSTLIAASTLFSDLTDAGFDVAIDGSDNFHVVYTAGTHIKWRKFSSSGASISGPVTLDTQSTPCLNPKVAVDPADSAVFVTYQCLTAPSTSLIYFRTLTIAGSLAVSPRSMAGALSNMVEPSIFVTDDLWVYLSWTDQTTHRVYYRTFDDIGNPLDSVATLVSGNTQRLGVGTLTDGAKTSKIIVTDNKHVVVGFLQDKGSGVYGLSFWSDGAAYMQTLISSGENFVDYAFQVEPIFNGINVSVAQSARADYVRLEDTAVLFALQLSTSGVAKVALYRDQLGSMIHAWSSSQAGTYTEYDVGVLITNVGPTSIVGIDGTIIVAPNQLVSTVSSFSTTPKAGDRVVIADSSAGNNGTYFIANVELITVGAPDDRYLITVTSNFASAETAIHGSFAAPDGNTSRFAKSVSDTKATAYRYSTLPTDILLTRIVTPGPIILNYVTHTGPSEIQKPYLVGGTNVHIDWGKTVADQLTLSGGMKLLNLLDNLVYNVADGSYGMVEGDAIYVTLDGSTMAVTPQIVQRALLPWGTPIQVLGAIQQGSFSPLLLAEEVTQLDVGEEDTLGEDLPQTLRARLGIVNETSFQSYSSTYVIDAADTYPESISKLDHRVEMMDDNHPDEEEYTGDGVTKIFTLTRFLLNSSNSVFDNQVWVAGRKQRQDPTGGLTRSYRKISTTQIEFVEAPRLNDEVVIRKEGINYGGPTPPISGQLWSDPVDSDILTPDLAYKAGDASHRFLEAHAKLVSTERVEMPLPIGTVTNIKVMTNGSLSAIPAGQPVSKYSDGKIYPADSDSAEGQSFIGITVEVIPFGGSGRVFLPGPNIPGVLASLGIAPGADVYLDESSGGYTSNPGGLTGGNDTIMRLGVADCGDGVVSAAATDLVMMTYVIARP